MPTFTLARLMPELVDVTFPVYRKHVIDVDDHPSSTIYMRMDEVAPGVLRQVSIHVRDRYGHTEIEIGVAQPYTIHAREQSDYVLGRGEYASSADEFNHALTYTRTFVADLR